MKKIGKKGCGIGCLSFILIGGILFFLIYKKSLEMKNDFISHHQKKGYKLVTGVGKTELVIDNRIKEDTIFEGAIKVIIDAESDARVAIFAIEGVIKKDIRGKLSFFGQKLIIEKGVRVDEVEADCIIVRNLGDVTKEIKGNYQKLIYE